jgi:hypothetical protein
VATSLVGFAMIGALLLALVVILFCADRLFSGGYVCSPTPRERRRARRSGVRRRSGNGRLAVARAGLGAVPRRLTQLPTAMATVRRDRGSAARPTGRRQFRPALVAARRPLQAVAADLRRLNRELALVPAGTPMVRWRALWSAYDGVLMEAADLLQVPHELRDLPDQIGMERDLERLRVLAALEGAGLVVD